MPARPPPAAVQPRPGGAALATPRARTSPPSMKLSRPLPGTGVARDQWDGAGAWGSRPCAASEAGAVPGRGGRVSSPGADTSGEARPLQSGGLNGPLAGAPRPPPLLTPADPKLCWVLSFCRHLRHTSWHLVAPLSLPNPKEPSNACAQAQQESSQGLHNFVGLSLMLGPHLLTCTDEEEYNQTSYPVHL